MIINIRISRPAMLLLLLLIALALPRLMEQRKPPGPKSKAQRPPRPSGPAPEPIDPEEIIREMDADVGDALLDYQDRFMAGRQERRQTIKEFDREFYRS